MGWSNFDLMIKDKIDITYDVSGEALHHTVYEETDRRDATIITQNSDPNEWQTIYFNMQQIKSTDCKHTRNCNNLS